ncbi:hypothetical protein [Streptomyces mirabilis]|uniref:hypothetical protein n=1 Tax=Streptomyces mirabilis TaxID=68239 RepID=UPI003662A11C
MLDSYSLWGSKIEHGNTQHAMYSELLEFVNLRMETADSCLTLIENEKIADALGLGRSLLEHYLLFMLMCRGKKYFQVQDLTGLTEGEFKKRLKAQQEDLAQKQADDSTKCLEVRRYTRGRYLMYVFEGLHSGDEPEFTIPMHFFQHQEFRPEVMRLKDGDYFQYYEDPEDVKKALKVHTREAEFRYKYYLSYGALLECLDLNGLVVAGDQILRESKRTTRFSVSSCTPPMTLCASFTRIAMCIMAVREPACPKPIHENPSSSQLCTSASWFTGFLMKRRECWRRLQ